MRIVEANLNLRIEDGKTNMDYTLEKSVAESLCSLKPMADVYAMVEYMDCHNEEFLKFFKAQGYVSETMLDVKRRGILIEVKEGYSVVKKHEIHQPHLLHLEITKEDMKIDLVVMRILVGRYVNAREFASRKSQFEKVYAYIKMIASKNFIITGDFNNAKIRDDYKGYAQECYNYQWIRDEFKKLDVDLVYVKGFSHKGYLKEDHIALGTAFRKESADYDQTLFDNRFVIGYPDHKPLVVDIAKNMEKK